MVLHNVNAQIVHDGGNPIAEIDAVLNDLRESCTEKAIVAAEQMVAKYGMLTETAIVAITME
jgi:hypothetical protein